MMEDDNTSKENYIKNYLAINNYVTTHDMYTLQRILESEFKLLGKSFDFLEKQIEYNSMNIKKILKKMNKISAKNDGRIKSYVSHKEHHTNAPKHNLNSTTEKLDNLNVEVFDLDKILDDYNMDSNMIIHMKDGDSPAGLDILKLFGIISNTESSPDNITEEDTDSVSIDYDSDDEFEELNMRIETVSDLLKLCDLYEELIGSSKEDILMDTPKEPITTIDTTDKVNRTFNNICEINGKKYSLNLKIIHDMKQPLLELNGLIGLTNIKRDITKMILYYIQHFESSNNNLLHTVIEGPPGTGKTELGKILSELYTKLGIFKKAKFTSVKRSDLIAGYLGHTAKQTQKVIDEASPGVLFIDEAYALGNEEKRDSFAKECIDTINHNLTENKNKLICIIAGYKDELERCFFSFNPGLKSRFLFKFTIDKYEYTELRDIFIKKLYDLNWQLSETIDKDSLTQFFKMNIEKFPFYGRDIEKLITHCKFIHSERIAGKHPKLRKKMTLKDIQKGLEKFEENVKTVESDHYKSFYS